MGQTRRSESSRVCAVAASARVKLPSKLALPRYTKAPLRVERPIAWGTRLRLLKAQGAEDACFETPRLDLAALGLRFNEQKGKPVSVTGDRLATNFITQLIIWAIVQV